MDATIFPQHKCGLYLTHNDHRDIYMPLAQWIDEDGWDCFESDAEKAEAIATDEIWTLQWYPATPIGFIQCAAPTLEKLLTFAKSVEAK